MRKKCPDCLNVYDDNYEICAKCGSRLVEDVECLEGSLNLNIGDANAISGGVNINRSKNITHHDTHYHSTTVNERAKSEVELKLEATNQLRSKAANILAERGRIDSIAMGQLRPYASQLGIDDETFKSIIKEVRSNRNGGASCLGAANARYLLQAQQAVQTNDMDALSNLTPRLEAMATISQDDNVQYLYYLTLSLLYPIKSMEVYKHQTDENYWRSFWAIISYIRTGKYAEATKVLALFEPVRFEKSEEDQNLLEAYFNIMKEDNDGAQEFLDEILGEPSEQIKPLLRAIESKLYEEEVDSLEVRFYTERVLSKSDAVIKTTRKVGTLEAAEISSEDVGKYGGTNTSSQNTAEVPTYITETIDEIIGKINNNDYIDFDLYIQRLSPAVKKYSNPLLHYYYFVLRTASDMENLANSVELSDVDNSYWQIFWSAYSYAYLGQYSKAEELVSKLCELWPNYPSANITLMHILIDVFRSCNDYNIGRDAIKNRFESMKSALSTELSGLCDGLRYTFGMNRYLDITKEGQFYHQWIIGACCLYPEVDASDENCGFDEPINNMETGDVEQEVLYPATNVARILNVNIYNHANQIELFCSLEIDNCKINSEYPVTVQWGPLGANKGGEYILFIAQPMYENTVFGEFSLAVLGYDDLMITPEYEGVHDFEFIIRVHDETEAIIGTKTITCQLEGKYSSFKDRSVKCLQIYKVY